MDFDEEPPLPPSAFLSRPHSHLGQPRSKGPSPLPVMVDVEDPAVEMIRQLRGEIERMRDDNMTLRHHETVSGGGRGGLRDVVTEQAEDITRLKKEMDSAKGEAVKVTTRLQCQLEVKDKEIKCLRTDFQERLDQLCSDYNRQLSETRQLLEVSQLHQSELETRSRATESQLRGVIRERETNCAELKQQLTSRREELEGAQHKLAGLRSMMAEMEGVGGWEKVRESMLREKEDLVSRVDQLTIKLRSAEKLADVEHDIECGDVEAKSSNPLHPWRRALLGLLVQRESARLTWEKELCTSRREVDTWRLKVSEGAAERASLQAKMTRLTAELDNERRRNKDLKERIRSSGQEAAQLSSRISSDESSLRALAAQLSSTRDRSVEADSQVTAALLRLHQLEHRVEAASGRLPLLRAHMARLHRSREEGRRGEGADGGGDGVNKARRAEEQLAEVTQSLSFTREELDRVRTERDSLIGQLENDTRSFEERVQHARQAVADSVEELTSRVANLEAQLMDKDERLESLEETLSSVREERDRLVIGQSRVGAELEAALSETRRDHAQAVLTLRQTERELEAERREREAQIASLQTELEATHNRLSGELREVTAERNIMRATLRQEGLLASSAALPGRREPFTAAAAGVPQAQLSVAHQFPVARNDGNLTERPVQESLMSVIQEVSSLAKGLSDSSSEDEV